MSDLILLSALAFIQNASFTWVGRSRASGNVLYHGIASVFSNSIWFAMTITIWGQLFDALTTGDMPQLIAAGIAYCIGTVAGSCSAMWVLLRTEKGSHRVGARV